MEDTTPATKADIRRLAESMDQRFAKVHQDLDRVLEILAKLQKHAAKMEADHERRITRLESHVGLVA